MGCAIFRQRFRHLGRLWLYNAAWLAVRNEGVSLDEPSDIFREASKAYAFGAAKWTDDVACGGLYPLCMLVTISHPGRQAHSYMGSAQAALVCADLCLYRNGGFVLALPFVPFDFSEPRHIAVSAEAWSLFC